MKTAKEIAMLSAFVATLIGGQFVLSAISGVEIVTVLAVSFFFYFGVLRGGVVATAFSLLRCLLFGFFPTVVALYLIYYNLLALIFGLLGKAFARKINVKKLTVIVAVSLVCTVAFTMLDNAITIVFYSFTKTMAKAYISASLITMIPQLVCVFATVSLLFYPLYKVYKTIKI
ncbi:MAG: hypothetical protein J6V66_03415 [Clostridia bacterium]|nr:hypothetical protein [Clostridia bacterium]